MFDGSTIVDKIVLFGAAVGLVLSCVMLGGSVLAHAKRYAVVSLIGIALCMGGICTLCAGGSDTGFVLSMAGLVISFVLVLKTESNN